MQLDKKKYAQKEVLIILEAYKREYEERFSVQCVKINELTTENTRLQEQINELKGKEELILSVLKRAEQTALDLEKQSQLEYELELERLKNFSKKWDDYFDKLKAKYPASKNIKKAAKIKDKPKAIDKKLSPKQMVKELEKLIDDDKKIHPVFDPKKKIGDYIAATSDNGFNLEEVLNPGELQLEDICKELGLIDSNE